MIDIDWDKVNEEWREGNTPWSDHVDRYIDSLIKQSNTNETDIKALKGEVEDNRQRLRYLDGGSEVGEGFVLGETTKLSHRIDNLTKEVEALKGHKHSYDGFGKTRITRSIICPPEQPTVEQGRYECICCHCGEHFHDDNKRQVACPECRKPVDDKPEKDHANPRYWYECQESAFAPGIADGWPEVIPAPHTANGRLVRREYPTPNNPEIPDSCEESQQTIDDKPDPAPPEGIAPHQTLEQIAGDGVKSAEKLKGHWECTECGKDWGDGKQLILGSPPPQLDKNTEFTCVRGAGYDGCGRDAVKWIGGVEDATAEERKCPVCANMVVPKDRGNVFYCNSCGEYRRKELWIPEAPESDNNPNGKWICKSGCGKIADSDIWQCSSLKGDFHWHEDIAHTVKWIPAVEDTTAPNEGADDPSAMEGVDLGIINDQWVEIDRLKAENAELSDKLHDFEINDFRNTPDKVPESEGITEHAILSRYAPPPKAPVDDPSAPIKVIKKDYADMCAEVKALSDMIITYKESSLQNRNIVSRVYKENAELKARLDKMRTDSFFWEDLAETRGARHIAELRAHHKTKADYDELIDDCASLNKSCDAYEKENVNLAKKVGAEMEKGFKLQEENERLKVDVPEQDRQITEQWETIKRYKEMERRVGELTPQSDRELHEKKYILDALSPRR